jgi:hypothetical protein
MIRNPTRGPSHVDPARATSADIAQTVVVWPDGSDLESLIEIGLRWPDGTDGPYAHATRISPRRRTAFTEGNWNVFLDALVAQDPDTPAAERADARDGL